MPRKIFIIIPVILLLFISSCKKDSLSVNKLEHIEIQSAEFFKITNSPSKVTVDDTGSIKELVKLLNQFLNLPESEDHQMVGDILISIQYPDKTLELNMDFDTQANIAYIDDGEKVHIVEDDNYIQLANSTFFSSFLEAVPNYPKLDFSINGAPVLYHEESEFSYTWFNNITKTDTISDDNAIPVIYQSDINPQFSISFNVEPILLIQKIYYNDELIFSTDMSTGSIFIPNEDGLYEVELIATWDTSSWKQATAHYYFNLEYDLPVSFELPYAKTAPGDLFVIYAYNVNEGQVVSATAPFLKEDYVFYPYQDKYVTFIPVPPDTKSGEYIIELTSEEGVIQENQLSTFDVQITEKEFDVQHLIVSDSTEAIRSNENLAKDQEYFDRATANPISEKLWEGQFLKPTEGIMTTQYGQIRYTNDNPVPRIHNGVDLANKLGTPIYAANTGKVVLTHELNVTGNTIIIDHGMGLYSYYFHLDKILVEEGSIVNTGDLIAEMGTTGFSTGSHLHFSVSIGDIYLNPWYFIDNDILP